MIPSHTLRNTFILLIFGMLLQCRTVPTGAHNELLAYFKTNSSTDTLHIEISNEMLDGKDTIPNALFFAKMPQKLIQPIDYLVDSSETTIMARQRISIDGQFTLYWIEFQLFWFQNHSLFVYDNSKRTFTQRVTVAEWFGGEGGQTLTGSWVFDFDGNGKKDIVRREIQHSMNYDGEDLKESLEEKALLLLWRQEKFSPKKGTKQEKLAPFPIESYW